MLIWIYFFIKHSLGERSHRENVWVVGLVLFINYYNVSCGLRSRENVWNLCDEVALEVFKLFKGFYVKNHEATDPQKKETFSQTVVGVPLIECFFFFFLNLIHSTFMNNCRWKSNHCHWNCN